MEPNGSHAAVPILGMQTFVCKVGHAYKGLQAFRLTLPIGPNQGLTSAPVCPFCYLDNLAFQFPQWPEGKTLEQAIQEGLLDPRAGGA